MLVAMDGNESLKQVQQAKHDKDTTGRIISSEDIEQEDSCDIHTSLYLGQDIVDRYKNEVKQQKQSGMVCEAIISCYSA
jgi:hypothetical protein